MSKFNTVKQKVFISVLLFILLMFVSLLYYQIHKIYNIGIPCLFHEITGLYCPGCGITRTLFALIELDFKSAIQYNLLIFILAPFMIFYAYKRLTNWILLKNSYIFPNFIWYILLFITIVFGVLRNINQFSWLAPLS